MIIVRLQDKLSEACYTVLVKSLQDQIIIRQTGTTILIKDGDIEQQKISLNEVKDILRDYDINIKNIQY